MFETQFGNAENFDNQLLRRKNSMWNTYTYERQGRTREGKQKKLKKTLTLLSNPPRAAPN